MASVDLVMPQMGESIAEGTIIRWLKKEGERIQRDEIILEISTDKVDSEIPSPYEGVMDKIMVPEGETVKVGSVIAQIRTEAEETQATEPSVPVLTVAPPEPVLAPAAVAPEPVSVQPATLPQPATSSDDAPAEGLVDVMMPQMGESIAEGTIISWLKKEGQTVQRDEILLEISTDKVDSEIPSPQAGILHKIVAAEGETVKVGSIIAHIATSETSAVVSTGPPAAAPEPAPVPASPTRPGVQPGTAAQTVNTTRQVTVAGTNGERRFYSPLVRRIAKAEGISPAELAQIQGTGAHGRVTKKDILNYLDTRPAAPRPALAPAPGVAPAAPPPVQPVSADDRVEIIPMNTMRKSIARHMVASIQTSAHVFAVSEADMTDLVAFRSQNKETFLQKAGTKLTYMPFITRACVKALLDYPLVNSSVQGDNIIRKKDINIGIAVALENNGLIVPVVKHADGLNLLGLARAINDLAARARSKKLKPDEVQGGTFSITNMGSFGSLMGLPIINQPQVAILGVGAIQKRPVVINDAIAIRSMMYISLSFDHRIVDGALAGQFLDRVAFNLTHFDTTNIV
ncbi:MAG: 2-oxoglutarate dehydrogenase, E2 component, dihydrolipoamide succinyltransferase [bacterium]